MLKHAFLHEKCAVFHILHHDKMCFLEGLKMKAKGIFIEILLIKYQLKRNANALSKNQFSYFVEGE